MSNDSRARRSPRYKYMMDLLIKIGSWTEVAVERMKQGGKIITIDLLGKAIHK